jgi:lipopolysaccharide/colanic/teichoic acid biosynthesis glycosyltransferase
MAIGMDQVHGPDWERRGLGQGQTDSVKRLFRGPASAERATMKASLEANLEAAYRVSFERMRARLLAEVADWPITRAKSGETFWSQSKRKRVFDAAAASILMFGLLPVLVTIALAIRLSSRGPALVRERRSGLGQVPFLAYRYRTMAWEAGGWRLTVVGRWLRRFRLDGLPRMINVLRGEMSLVGPTPAMVGEETASLVCRPGMTGAAALLFACESELMREVPAADREDFRAQVLGPMKMRLDGQYCVESGFWSDLGILVRTATTLGRPGCVVQLRDLAETYRHAVEVTH